MGMAASQARFLFITARQNDVSAGMQRISNDQMSLTRDEDAVYTKYNTMLNATNLKFKDSTAEISYDALMGNTSVEAGKMNMLTEASSKKVVLDSKYASALPSSNKDGEKAQYSDANAVTFIKNITGNSQIPWDQIVSKGTVTNKATITVVPTWENSDAYKAFVNNNGTRLDKTETKAMTLTSIASQMGNIGSSACNGQLRGFGISSADTTWSQVLNSADKNTSVFYLAGGEASGYKNSNLLNKVDTELNEIIGSIASAFSSVVPLSDPSIKAALQSASDATKKQFSVAGRDTQRDVDYKYESSVADSLFNTANISREDKVISGRSWNKDDTFFYAVNGRNLMNYFYRAFQSAYNGQGNSGISNNSTVVIKTMIPNERGLTSAQWDEKAKDAKNEWSKTDASKPYTKLGDVEIPADKKTLNKANNYKSLYQQICDNGYIVDSKANDNKSLNDKLSKGVYLINSVYASKSELFEEIADKDVQAKADAWYEHEMSSITRKEKSFQNDLTKLQTEYTSLNTEAESVKGVIKENVERTLKSFSA